MMPYKPVPIVVLGLLNTLLGSTILVLPHIALQSGWATSLLSCLAVGAVCTYTARLMMLHCSNSSSVEEAIVANLGSHSFIHSAYSVLNWANYLPYCIIYFRLICLQLTGIIGPSPYMGEITALLLLVLLYAIRYYQVKQEIIGYGVVGVGSILAFLLWAQFTTPLASKPVPATGPALKITTALLQSFCIHNFSTQTITANTHPSRHQRALLTTFLSAVALNAFIVLGCFAIASRSHPMPHPQTLADYFANADWELLVIQGLYLMHLLSVLPFYVLQSKIQSFLYFRQNEQKQINSLQMYYIVGLLLVLLLIYKTEVYVETIIYLNGAIFGFIFAILLPVLMHIRCMLQQYRRQQYLEVDPTGYQPALNQSILPPIRSRGWMLAEIAMGGVMIVLGAMIVLGVVSDIFYATEVQ